MELSKSQPLRIAHLSDPHFSQVTYGFKQFLSKRWLGNLNLILFRRRSYVTEHLWHLPDLLESLKVETVFITGDFSSTSLESEFQEGKKFVDAFKAKHLPVYAVPGNHDCYTRRAARQKRFAHYFSSESLKQKKVECIALKRGWWYIGLDCAVPAPLFCAYGNFSKMIESHLESALSGIPKEDRVIVCNHFPLFPANRPKHDLKRAKVLQKLLKAYPQVKLYLHGHDHSHYVEDRQKEGHPLVLNSGSCAHQPDGTFYLIDLFERECLVQRLLFRKQQGTFSWVIDWQRHFDLR